MPSFQYKREVRRIIRRALRQIAHSVQHENVARLKKGRGVNNEKLEPLNNFYKVAKSIQGYPTHHGERTGHMVSGLLSKNAIRFPEGTVFSVQILTGASRIQRTKVKWFQKGGKRKIKSPEQSRALRAKLGWYNGLLTKATHRTDRKPFAEGLTLTQPPRPFFGVSKHTLKVALRNIRGQFRHPTTLGKQIRDAVRKEMLRIIARDIARTQTGGPGIRLRLVEGR